MGEIRPRVTGTEIEWSVGLRRIDSVDFEPVDEMRLGDIAKYVVSEYGNGRSSFLTNGDKCYVDYGNLEYATREDDSVYGTVSNEIAGEQIIENAIKQYVENSKKYDEYQLLKRVQYGSCTTGYHINYCADATKLSLTEASLYELALWAGTISMITGAGCLNRTSPASHVQFAVGQKTLVTRYGFRSDHTIKPLVSLRDQPHADINKFHRIQIVGLDPNISPWASWMQIVTGSLCLRALEQNIRNPNLKLRSQGPSDEPLARLARAVATHPKLDAIIEREDLSTIRAVDIQWELLKSAQQTEHTEEEARGLSEWEKSLAAIEGDKGYLQRKSGWMIRLDKLQKFADRNGLTFDAPELMQRDRKWDDIQKGMAKILRPLIGGNLYDPKFIEERRTNPCPNTRSLLRAQAVEKSKFVYYGMFDWDQYQLGNDKQVQMIDPLENTLPSSEDML